MSVTHKGASRLSTFVGIDIAKELHWVAAIDSAGGVLLDRKLANTTQDLMNLVAELRGLPGPIRIGIDVLGGIASLTQAVLLQAGFDVVHVSGLAVDRARQGTVGGESKSDPRDARVIADQVPTRRDLRPVESHTELDPGAALARLAPARSHRGTNPSPVAHARPACLDLPRVRAVAGLDH